MSYASALRQRWWIPLAAAVLGAAVAGLLSARQTPVHRATATLAATTSTAVEGTSDILRALEGLEQRTVLATLARIPGSPETRARAAERLQVAPSELAAYAIEGSVVAHTNLLRIEVRGPDPARAAEIADAVAAVTRREARDLYRVYALRPIASAQPSRQPVQPVPLRNAAVGGVLGLFVGLLGAVAAEAGRRAAD